MFCEVAVYEGKTLATSDRSKPSTSILRELRDERRELGGGRGRVIDPTGVFFSGSEKSGLGDFRVIAMGADDGVLHYEMESIGCKLHIGSMAIRKLASFAAGSIATALMVLGAATASAQAATPAAATPALQTHYANYCTTCFAN